MNINEENRNNLTDQELFERYTNATNKALRASGTGKTAEFYKNQLFPTLSSEQIEEMDKAKEAVKDTYKELKQEHKKGIENN